MSAVLDERRARRARRVERPTPLMVPHLADLHALDDLDDSPRLTCRPRDLLALDRRALDSL